MLHRLLPVLVDPTAITNPALRAAKPGDHVPKEPRFIGSVFAGRYRIEGLVGRGGMGAVYRATQVGVNRPVAVKILRPELASKPSIVKRFKQEAKAIASLHHRNIVAIEDYGQAKNGSMFLVMELLEGESLTDIIRRDAPLQWPRIRLLVRQVIDALTEAHSAGIVHRDLKPDNIFVARGKRGGEVVKVLDFGIAKVSDSFSDHEAELTQAGVVLGSPRYIAPEQARSQTVSQQTDLYAIGIMLYEMLSGGPLFDGNSATDLLVAHVHKQPAPIVRTGGELAGPLIDLTMQCLEKIPELRPASAKAMAATIDGWRKTPYAEVPRTDTSQTSVMSAEFVENALRHVSPVGTGVTPVGSSTSDEQAEIPVTSDSGKWWFMGAAALLIAAGGFFFATQNQGDEPAPMQRAVIKEAPATVASPSTPAPAAPAVDVARGEEPIAKPDLDLTVKPAPAVASAAVRPPVAEPIVIPADPPAAPAPAAAPAKPLASASVRPPVPEPIIIKEEVAPAPIPMNSATINSRPAGASVYVNGRRVGLTPVAVEWGVGTTPPLVSIKKDGARELVQLRSSDAGSSRTVTFKAKRSSPKPKASKPKTSSKKPAPEPKKPAFKMLD